MFQPRLALASLSGESDAQWAIDAEQWAGMALLGGLALDAETRDAARRMVANRDRSEFLPQDPFAFMADQLGRLAEHDVKAGFNVRAAGTDPIRRAAEICTGLDAVLEINAHCRQQEMTGLGAGQSLLREPARLAEQVRIAAEAGATVSVKVRAEVPDVDLPAVCRVLDSAGTDIIHVDAMDSESIVGEIVEGTDAFVIANNGVRDRETVREYLEYGADAVSVGRPSDDPRVLKRVHEAVRDWELD
ncbi:MAG: tRNA-dihydrouridine synthase [Halodesulfurarchaeum sp.]|nr:tRNA-dihydrouridine synthase [Halodesulfurarchaeum sp.]